MLTRKSWYFNVLAARHFSAGRSGANNFRNAAGIHHLQEDIQAKLFKERIAPSTLEIHDHTSSQLQELSLSHLSKNGLLDQETTNPSKLNIELPELLEPADLDAHFQKIGHRMSEPYLSWCRRYIATNDKLFSRGGVREKISHVLEGHKFRRQSGWVRYEQGKAPETVSYPAEKVITFDTEVLFKIHEYAVIATAVAGDVLYVWLSPWLLGESESTSHLIPLGPHQQAVIGHYVSFDRKRVKEEYNLSSTKKWYMDTMGFHIAANGMSGQQRAVFTKYEKLAELVRSEPTKDQINRQLFTILQKEPWIKYTAGNGLSSAVKYHLGETLKKDDREYFAELNRDEAAEPEMLEHLIKYCATDSFYTQQLFGIVLPKFLALNPHPVSFGALREIGSLILPIDESWETYKETAESYFIELQDNINGKLRKLAEDASQIASDPESMKSAQQDPWLSQLDWTLKPVKYTKGTKKSPPRPVKNQKMPGKPEWYKELFKSAKSDIMSLSSRSRTTILLLRLKWDEYPLEWSDQHGWSIWVEKEKKGHYAGLNLTLVKQLAGKCMFKLPHPDGASARCISPLAKFYVQFFENGTLKSDNKLAMEAIYMNIECSYWVSCRQRVNDQMAVYQSKETTPDMGLPDGWGLILPRMAPIGAVTRRAVEDTWLTASNAKKNRIGSELKSNIKAPPGFKIIGADVDSEELWIASVVGDSVFKMHGGTAIGWMTLEGTKKAGTDLHSKSAKILGISRNEAKVFNYGRIYGAGKASAARNLRQFNPSLSVKEAEEKARQLYSSTKGVKTKSKHFPLRSYWRGGTESVVYNQLELLAEQPRQKTPVLGAGISDALSSDHLLPGSYLTTRTNWSIQSSGVDYLHLLIAGMHYLCEAYDISARLMITVHDEVRYLAKEEDAYRAGFALQIANLWTRAMFCHQLGFDSIPYSVSFFSSVDFDYLLRKEVDDPCITPTQPDDLKAGEALSMVELVQRCSSLGSLDAAKYADFKNQPSLQREPLMRSLNNHRLRLNYARAQVGTAAEAKKIEADLDQRSLPHESQARARSAGVRVTSYHKNSNIKYQKVVGAEPPAEITA